MDIAPFTHVFRNWLTITVFSYRFVANFHIGTFLRNPTASHTFRRNRIRAWDLIIHKFNSHCVRHSCDAWFEFGIGVVVMLTRFLLKILLMRIFPYAESQMQVPEWPARLLFRQTPDRNFQEKPSNEMMSLQSPLWIFTESCRHTKRQTWSMESQKCQLHSHAHGTHDTGYSVRRCSLHNNLFDPFHELAFLIFSF